MANSTFSAGVSFSAAREAVSQAPEFSQKRTIHFEPGITCASMLLICFQFLFAATKNRLWHANSPIGKLLKFVLDQIRDPLVDLAIIYLLSDPPKNIYIVWGVILMIANGTLTCAANTHTLSDSKSDFMKLFFILLLSYSLIGPCQHIESADPFSKFVINLWVMWGLIILKTVEKFFSFRAAKHAYRYGTNLISDYMQFEHKLSTGTFDPVSMRGYKYIVSGEDKVSFETEIVDDRQAHVVMAGELSDEVVTVERVWDCRGQLLGPKMDPDAEIKDICLSFALMKLLKRRFHDYLTEEPNTEELYQVPKSAALVFQGLLESKDKNRAFRVIMTELGFLEDVFFSQYPIIFGRGWPIYNYLLSLLLSGATSCLVITAYNDTRNLGGDSTDFFITFVLAAMINIMEITDTATYLLSDWNKVRLLINYVKFPWLQKIYFINTALRFLCKITIIMPRGRDKIGQYSLLEQHEEFSIRANLVNRREKFHLASVKLPDEAKNMILDQISQLSRGPLSNGESSLSRNGMEELGWTCKLPSSTQTILLWHIATCICEATGPSQPPLTSSGKEVATALSKYCAYLVVFFPDLLPDQGIKATRVLDKVTSEIKDCLEEPKDVSEMLTEDRSRKNLTILEMGVELGKTLVVSISDEHKRWKVLAEFWAEYVLYLAPSSNVEAHRESLGSGVEFITHLWALLYHAGVLERPEIAPNTYP